MTRLVRRRRFGRAELLALGAGIATAAGLPPFHLLPLSLVGFSLMLTLAGNAGSWGRAAWRGFLFGWGYHLLGLLWITNAILVRADTFWWFVPFATPSLALVLAPFAAVPAALAAAVPRGLGRLLAFAGSWTLAELLREVLFTGFPWNPPGSVWEFTGPFGDMMVQAASLMGVAGLSGATVFALASPAAGPRALFAAVLLLLAWSGFGLLRLDRPPPAPPGLDVVLVQGNVSEGEKLGRRDPSAIFRRYLDLTREGVGEAGDAPSVVAWPETASPYTVEGDGPAEEMIAAAARPARASFVGAIRFSPDGRPRNSMIVLDGDGHEVGVYDKSHLVPWGEYTPAVFPIQVVPGGGLEAGGGPTTLHVTGVPPLAPLICYEAIFSGAVVKRGDRPAWILNITNDGWYADSAGPRQHLEAARMRAVEEGLPLARAANTGISAVFDAYGRETGRLFYGETGVLVRQLPGALPPTLFSRDGNRLPLLLGVVSTLVGIFLGVLFRRNRLKPWTIPGGIATRVTDFTRGEEWGEACATRWMRSTPAPARRAGR